MPTASEIAEWMVERYLRRTRLPQDEIARALSREFGDDAVYRNKNGNLAIKPGVLREFRKRTEDTLVWLRSEKAWRHRTQLDGPGRGKD